MRRILCSDWLPEQARWSDTACPPGTARSSRCTKAYFPEIIFFLGKKIFCDFSVFMEPEKASTRMKTKKTKMLISFKNTFYNKNRQTQKFVFNLKL